MTDWHPRDAIPLWRYPKFKLRMWTKIDHPPDWVRSAKDGFYDNDVPNHENHSPKEETLRGDSLEYKIKYDPNAHPTSAAVASTYYARIKR